jgi:hypothetical protein
MHILNRCAILITAAALTLTACQQILTGHPDFPTAGMLPTDGQRIVAASSNSPAPLFALPAACQKVIAVEDGKTADLDGPLPVLGSVQYVQMKNNCIEIYLGAIDF